MGKIEFAPKLQKIGNVSNSNVIAINGDVIIDGTVFNDIQNSLLETIKQDIMYYSQTAIEATKEEIKAFSTSIITEICRTHTKEYLVSKFASISLQATIHDAILGYITNEDVEVKILIIDVFIERLRLDNNDSEALTLNKVISILPKLNQIGLNLIALMTLRHLIIPLHPMLDDYWRRLSPIIDVLPNVRGFDIDYLRKTGSTEDVTGLYPINSFENHLLKQYDLYFRKRIPHDEWEAYCSRNPIIRSVTNDGGTCMFCYTDSNISEIRFFDSNSKVLSQRLVAHNQTELIPLIEELKRKYPLYSPQEVRTHMCSFNKNWDIAFELLNTSLVRIRVNTCGLYIGSRLIDRLEGGKGCSLKDMYNKISL